MPPVGFEPTISASERPQTYALDRAATGTHNLVQWLAKNYKNESIVTVDIDRDTIDPLWS